MSEHHPSCTPNDRDLVWHCNQCGLNESAEPTTDEWTPDNLRCAIEVGGYEGAAIAINAALAAEREKWKSAEDLTRDNGRLHGELARYLRENDSLQSQLAAERELRQHWERKTQEAQTQLAAEREKGVKVYLQLTLLEKQLAAERESDVEPARTIRELREQLAAEKKETENVANQWFQAEQGFAVQLVELREQLAAEREKGAKLSAVVAAYGGRITELEQQLAAERERSHTAEAEQKATEAAYDMIATENRQLRKQFAAEREKVRQGLECISTRTRERDSYKEQLDAERRVKPS